GARAIGAGTPGNSPTSAALYTSSAFSGDGFADDFRLLKWTGAETSPTIGAEEAQGAGPPPLPAGFGKSAPANGATGQGTTPTLAWTASSGATSYEYCVDTSANATCDTSWTSTTGFSAALSGLAANTSYSWQVRAVNSAGSTQADSGTWFSFTTQSAPQAPWLDPAWLYRRAVTVGNLTVTALTNYQVQLTLDTTFDFTHAQSDGRDLRVTDGGGTTLAPFWIQAWDATARRATIWVKIPSVPAGGGTVYLYYGNAAASATGNPTTTLDVFDGFEALAVGAPPA